MIDPNHRPLIATRFYTLAEAGEDLGIAPFNLLRLGAAGHLNLCVALPANTRAYTIDPQSTAIRGARAAQDKVISRIRPAEAGIPMMQDGDIVALRLTPHQCREVAAFGFSRMYEFLGAYSVNYTFTFGYSEPVGVTPVRLPLVKADGSAAPQHQWRFAIYPTEVQFSFDADAGYEGPLELMVSLDDIRVLGLELGRLPTALGASPSQETDTGESAPPFPSGKQPQPSSAGGAEDAPSYGKDPVQPQEKPTKKPRRRATKTSGDVASEGAMGGAVELLRLDAVMRRTKLGKTTIYDYLNPKHKLYDPRFPTPINIGNRAVGWIASEVDSWIQLRIGKSRKH